MANRCHHGVRGDFCDMCDFEENGAEMLADLRTRVETLENEVERLSGLQTPAKLIAATKHEEISLRAAFAMPVVASGKWNLLFPRGTFHGPNLKPVGGSLSIDDAFMSDCLASWISAGKPKLAVYKTHLHAEEDVPAADRLELEEAYGFITDLRASAGGLECFVEWNPAGVEAITSGKWAFWSAEWGRGGTNLLTGQKLGWRITGAALTNDPFFDNLPPLAAAANAANGGTNKPKETKMEELFQNLKQALKDAGDNKSALLAGLKAILDENGGSEPDGDEMAGGTMPTPPATTPAPDIAAAVTAAVKPLGDQLRASNERIEKLQHELLDQKVDAEVLKLKAGDGKRGRVVSDELIKAAKAQARSVGLEHAIKFMASLAPEGPALVASGVPGKPEGKPSKEEANKKLDALTAELRAKGTADARMVAMRENPELALIASGRN